MRELKNSLSEHDPRKAKRSLPSLKGTNEGDSIMEKSDGSVLC